MCDKVLFDVLPDSNGIFTAINKIKSFPWNNVITPTQMDTSYKQLYTNKHISKIVERYLGENDILTDDNISALASIIYNMYYEKWVLAYNLFVNRETSLIKGGYTKVIETTEHDYNTTDTGTTENINTETGQISAYNTDDFTNKDKTDNTGKNTRDLSGTDKGIKTRNYTKESFGENYADNYEKIILDLQKYLLYDIIYIDANSILAKHIY